VAERALTGRSGARGAERAGAPARPPHGLEALQRSAGNQAVAALVQRQVASPPAPPPVSTRPVLRRGDLNVDVGVAQQKLNVAGADPRLEVDAEFGSRTERAVRTFQRRHDLGATGVLDAATWAALDGAVEGGEIGPDGQPAPVSTGREADPTQHIETPIHPTLRPGSSGPAVNELHEKLNRALGLSLVIALTMDDASGITYDDETRTAVAAFQRRERLGFDGVAGPQTWARLDQVAPGAMIGRRQMTVSERVRGERFLRGNEVNYDYEVEGSQQAPTRLVLRVGYAFTVLDGMDDVPQRLFAGIRQVWNRFEAIELVQDAGAAPRGPVPIDFEPTTGTDQAVTIRRGPGPSNSSTYYITPDLDLALLGGHEFGHHIGLADEYQQTAADHERHTGEAVPIGEIHGDAPPEQIARELHRAIFSHPASGRGDETLAVIRAHRLEQGAFAQQVWRRYTNLFGQDILDAINTHVPQSQDEGSLTKRRLCTQPFLYNEPGLMEGAEASFDHAHTVEPRHVRHLVSLLAEAVGGTWEPATR
jgi:peptidoglycan hydrolase-like protein with peptidoglycan-binding domain